MGLPGWRALAALLILAGSHTETTVKLQGLRAEGIVCKRLRACVLTKKKKVQTGPVPCLLVTCRLQAHKPRPPAHLQATPLHFPPRRGQSFTCCLSCLRIASISVFRRHLGLLGDARDSRNSAGRPTATQVCQSLSQTQKPPPRAHSPRLFEIKTIGNDMVKRNCHTPD